jgi:hypothetical protein
VTDAVAVVSGEVEAVSVVVGVGVTGLAVAEHEELAGAELADVYGPVRPPSVPPVVAPRLSSGLPVSPPTLAILLGALVASCPELLVAGVGLPLEVSHAAADIASRRTPAIDSNAITSCLL